MSSICLLSSGLDSATSLAMAMAERRDTVLCLTFDYGQRAAEKEIRQAAQLARHYGIRHESMELPWFRRFPSGLIDSSTRLPEPSTEDLEKSEYTQQSARAVWVPNRNGAFLEIAAGIAESLGANRLIVGFNKEEAATFPDNSEDYLKAINSALHFSTAGQVQVESPTLHLIKQEIVAKAVELDLPFSLLWSCYQNEASMCGRCESCIRLKRALSANKVNTHALFEDSSHLG